MSAQISFKKRYSIEFLSVKSLAVSVWKFSIGCAICILPSISYFPATKTENTTFFYSLQDHSIIIITMFAFFGTA